VLNISLFGLELWELDCAVFYVPHQHSIGYMELCEKKHLV